MNIMAAPTPEMESVATEMENVDADEKTTKKKARKKKEAGIVYLSTIPPGMDVQIVRNIFSKYGPVGRMYLQPYPEKSQTADSQKKGPVNKKKKHRNYCEGWVEFLNKKTAKEVAALLNNKLVGGKRKSKFHDYLWNIKYLSRFKWIHLNERVAYEKASHTQRMRTEISQVKKQTNYYVEAVEKSRIEEDQLRRRRQQRVDDRFPMSVRQRRTDEEIRRQKKERGNAEDKPVGPDIELLQSVFG